jgi:hypothetical protein
VFWDRYKELADWKKYLSQIEKGEARLEKLKSIQQVITDKVSVFHSLSLMLIMKMHRWPCMTVKWRTLFLITLANRP